MDLLERYSQNYDGSAAQYFGGTRVADLMGTWI